MSTGLGRGALSLAALAVLWIPAVAGAKGPAITLESNPLRPKAGAPATITLRTWEWTPSGEADMSRPWAFFSARQLSDSVHGEVLAVYPPGYPARNSAFLEEDGYPLSFRKVGAAVFESTMSFPTPGRWIIAWVGSTIGYEELVVEVRPVENSNPSDTSLGLGRAVGLGGAAISTAGTVVLAFLKRRPTSREKGGRR